MTGVPPGLRISYQRMAATPPLVTLWVMTIDSWVPWFRYARRYMSRVASVSSCWATEGCGTHTPPPQAGVKLVIVRFVGPVKVELPGLAQFTLYLKSLT